MFPSVRLLLVATAASIVAIACGLGLFAAFRVSHDPLTRLANVGPPLQLGFTNAVLAPVINTPAASFGVRFQTEAPPSGNAEMLDSVPAIATAPAPAVPPSGDRADAVMPAPAAAPSTTERDQVAPAADQSPSAAQAMANMTAAPESAAAAEAQIASVTAAEVPDGSAAKTVRHRRAARRPRQQPAATTAQAFYQWMPATQLPQQSNVANGW